MSRLSFWRSPEVKRVPEPVLQYMRKRFMLPTLYISSLRCFETNQGHHGERVTRLRIFSPTLASSFGLTVNKISDLDQHPEVLQFEGYVDRRGRVYVADRRSPVKRKPRGVEAAKDDGGNGNAEGAPIPGTRLHACGPGS